MDIVRAKEIISILAEGIDPITGEVLPDNSICNKGEVVRALYALLDATASNKKKNELPQNAGKPWTPEDDGELKVCFEAGMSKKDMCTKFGRTSGSITSRLARLGLTHD